MARPPKPYLYRGHYCTSLGGVSHRRLCPEAAGAAKAREMLARLVVASPASGAAPPDRRLPPAGVTVAAAIDEFLDFARADCAPATYAYSRKQLAPFYRRFGARPPSAISAR